MNSNYKTHFNKKKAFTLIELLIVIAIIGILFIVLVSKVDFATDKAKATGVQTDFRSFQMALETVSKEKAGFNSFGWNTGDANANGVRDSVDEGDANEDGMYQDGETWTGHKKYLETWTNTYSLIKPGTTFADAGYDKDAIFALETAINKNLDLKLHITIDAKTGIITMANGAQDPWNTQYHGAYISAEDGMDRGAIVMYSNGANQKFGSEHDITNGVPTVIVPDNNKNGADDYSLVVCYTYTNGFGEVGHLTTGFSNNQVFMTGNGIIDIEINEDKDGNNDEENDAEVPSPIVLDGLFDSEGNRLATWDELVNTYGLDFQRNYSMAQSTTNGYAKLSTSLYSVIKNNSNLASATTLVIGNDVTQIYDYAFGGCNNITKIVIGETVANITDNAFHDITSLKQIDVHPNNAVYKSVDGNLYTITGKTLVKYAIGKTDSSFTINETVTTIKACAFYNETDLTTLSMNTGIVNVYKDAFYGCKNLKNAYYAGEVEDWCKISFTNEDSNPLRYNANLYFNNVLVENLIIPSTITEIKQSAFVGCGSIKNIYLPKELTKINDAAFALSAEINKAVCPNVESVFYAGTISDWMKVSVFSSPLYNAAFYCNNELITELVIPENFTTIPYRMFAGCSSIIKVTIPSNIKTIARDAFAYCSNLQEVIFSEGLTTIGIHAFDHCSSLTEIILPETVTTVDQSAFISCSNVRTIVIPANVTKLGQNAFGQVHPQLVCTVYATTPISNGAYIFGNMNNENIKIYVPAESVDAYKTAKGWKDHANQIFAME